MNKIELDFQILPTFNPKVILVVDTSYWGHIEDKPAIIEITLPGEKDPFTHYFDKGRVNTYNSLNLNTACTECFKEDLVELPDGIYNLTLKGSPDTFSVSKTFLKTDKTRLEMDEYISSLDYCSEVSKETMSKVNRMNFLLEAAESNTRMGNSCEAQELLFKVQKDLERLKNCKSCV